MTLTPEFPIVGVGASAGGVEALEGFFRGIPPAPGVAFVVVTHLSPSRESHLSEVVSRYTSLPVLTAVDNQQIEINSVYVLPRDALMSVSHRRLRVLKRPADLPGRRPIDLFFSALARDCGDFAAGVILSGGNSDGTLGIKAIKEHGGLTLAQAADGYGPRNPEMPDSAIASGLVDFALPAEEMGKIFITTELGGGGTSTAKSAGIAKAGVANVLKAAGILKGPIEATQTTWLDMPDGNCFLFAEDGGLIEPLFDLGDTVRMGDIVARIYPVGRTGEEPLNIRAKMNGILAARHFPGLIKSGDCVSVLASVVMT